jgi:hypothetical protein
MGRIRKERREAGVNEFEWKCAFMLCMKVIRVSHVPLIYIYAGRTLF